MAAPLLDASDNVLGVLSVWGEGLTEDDRATLSILGLHGGVALANLERQERDLEAARLDGAIKTSLTVAPVINNQLTQVLGGIELLRLVPDLPPACLPHLDRLDAGIDAITESVRQLQQIVRFIETAQRGLPPMLDLEQSSRPDSEAGDFA